MSVRSSLGSARRELERRGKGFAARALLQIPGCERFWPSGGWGFGCAVGAHYGDNSAAVHRYVRGALPSLDTWWAINRDSPDVAKARAAGPIAYRDDISTFARSARAEVLLISHGIHDVPGADVAGPALRVRLGHGLTALKKTRAPALRSIAQMNSSYGLVPVSSEYELKNKLTWGVARERLVVTGVPRFDDLVRRSPPTAQCRTILYMPTWRDWIDPSTDFPRTRFYGQVERLLGDRRLHELLDRHDLRLEVYVHRLMHAHAQTMARLSGNERVTILPTNADVQRHVAEARMLLTDYSSVTWDMLYLDRPVAFFHFDVDDYARERGAYLDLRTEMPGPVAFDARSTTAMLEDIVDNGFELSPAARAWQSRAFAFRDTDNCARVVAAIHDRLARKASSKGSPCHVE